MANPIQQGLKRKTLWAINHLIMAAMANPIQQGLKHGGERRIARRGACRNG